MLRITGGSLLAAASQAGGALRRASRTCAPSAPCPIQSVVRSKEKGTPKRVPFPLEQMTGIEPACLAWEASALPLSYICV